ncbi:MAG: aldehyde ferredoxin oxidoreductase family protein [Proteobacteria bacterium]|nr:aldehyde ferredoxin oxidoreductase family protein [Pseudomonadota bacterium]
MKGFFKKVLIINLDERRYYTEDIPDEVYRNFLGGKGLGIYLMLKRNRPLIDAFSPDNNFIINVGPVNDTSIWGSSRYGVFTKSPLTGYFSHSYSGGNVAEPISRTGFDAIILEGASSDPIFLLISDEHVEFHDATKIWGSDTYQTQDFLAKRIGKKDTGTLVIGPASENMVRFASVVNNSWRCAGRTGVGAVLGSKKVKALVFYGKQHRETANPEAIKGFRNALLEKAKTHPSAKFFKNVGTPGLVSIINTLEAFPTRYWHEGRMEGWEEISAEALHAHYSVKPHACRRCLLACGRLTRVNKGRYAGLTIEGPEYETIYVFGGLCLIKSLDGIIYLNDLCDRLGMDTITAGNLAAFVIEASRMGKIRENIDYGDVEGIATLLYKISLKEGIGGILAEGIVHAAHEWGLEDFAIHVKGMEPGGYDPRIFKGMGLAYATSDRGACHLRSTFFRAEITGIIPPDQIEGKAEVFIDFEDRLTLQDSLILCRFYRDLYLWDELAYIVEITTGMKTRKEDLQRIASHVQNATRVFNIREGLTRADDRLPSRFFDEGIGSKKSVITREELERLKDDYYRLRGWDTNGIPLEDLPLNL